MKNAFRYVLSLVLLAVASCGASPDMVAVTTTSTTPPSGLQLLCTYYPSGQFPYTLTSVVLTVPVQCNNQGQVLTNAAGGGGGGGGGTVYQYNATLPTFGNATNTVPQTDSHGFQLVSFGATIPGFSLASGPGTASGTPVYSNIVNFPSTQTVSGAVSIGSGAGTASGTPFYSNIVNFPSSQTVNGTVTVGNSSLNVNVGNVSLAVTQSGSWTFALTGIGTTSGNPIFVNCPSCTGGGGSTYAYNSTLPTFTSGNASTPQTDSNGRQIVTFQGTAQPVSVTGSPTVALAGGSQVALTGPGTAANNVLYTQATQNGAWVVGQSGVWNVNATIQNQQLTVGPGVNDNGAGQGITLCDQSTPINATASGVAVLINGDTSASPTKQVYVCGWHFTARDEANTPNVSLEQGQSPTSCGTTTLKDGPFATMTAGIAGINEGGAVGSMYIFPAGDSVCIKLSAAATNAVGGSIQWTLY